MAQLTEAQKAARQKMLAELASRKMEKSNLSPAQKEGRLKLLRMAAARKMGDKGATLEPNKYLPEALKHKIGPGGINPALKRLPRMAKGGIIRAKAAPKAASRSKATKRGRKR